MGGGRVLRDLEGGGWEKLVLRGRAWQADVGANTLIGQKAQKPDVKQDGK
jgi:hypothetical protein